MNVILGSIPATSILTVQIHTGITNVRVLMDMRETVLTVQVSAFLPEFTPISLVHVRTIYLF